MGTCKPVQKYWGLVANTLGPSITRPRMLFSTMSPSEGPVATQRNDANSKYVLQEDAKPFRACLHVHEAHRPTGGCYPLTGDKAGRLPQGLARVAKAHIPARINQLYTGSRESLICTSAELVPTASRANRPPAMPCLAPSAPPLSGTSSQNLHNLAACSRRADRGLVGACISVPQANARGPLPPAPWQCRAAGSPVSLCSPVSLDMSCYS